MRGVALAFILVVGAEACSMVGVPRIWAKRPGAQSKLFAFESGGKTGFIDARGRVVVRPVLPASIHEVGDFVDGLVRVGTRFYTEAGVEAFSAAGMVSDFNGGLAHVYLTGEAQSVIGRDGKERFRIAGSGMGVFSEGLASFEEAWVPGLRDAPGRHGFVDLVGQIQILSTFTEVGPFQGGMARAVVDGYCHVLTPEGYKEASATSGNATSCGGAPADAVKACPVGFIDRKGQFAIAAKFESARDFAEGLAAVRVGGKWGYMDGSGKMVIAPAFEMAHSFSEGLAAVRTRGKWGFIDKSGKTVIAAEMAGEPEDFSEGLAVAGETGKLFYLDRAGRVALAGPYREATAFVHGLAAARVSRSEVVYLTPAGRVVFRYRPQV